MGSNPRSIFILDTLSKGFDAERNFDVILMNPPFKGAVNADDINDNLPKNTTKSELLFLHLILRSLDMGGRVAVIVPDGVLFGSSRAHVEARRKMIEENRLDGVISMPSGVFKPYAGVSTAVLLFTRGGQTKNIWFYDMAHDGLSLDDKRTPVSENDIPDILNCWGKRVDKKFNDTRYSRVEELKSLLAPMKEERRRMQAEINRLTFESAIGDGPNPPAPFPKREGGEQELREELAAAQAKVAEDEAKIAPLQVELDRLTRQFWVNKEQVKANKYDLSASRYRQVDADAEYHEKPAVTLERLERLERVMLEEINELKDLFK